MSPKLPEPTTGTAGSTLERKHCSDGCWLWHGAFQDNRRIAKNAAGAAQSICDRWLAAEFSIQPTAAPFHIPPHEYICRLALESAEAKWQQQLQQQPGGCVFESLTLGWLNVLLRVSACNNMATG
jgi:hypothetical protein